MINLGYFKEMSKEEINNTMQRSSVLSTSQLAKAKRRDLANLIKKRLYQVKVDDKVSQNMKSKLKENSRQMNTVNISKSVDKIMRK